MMLDVKTVGKSLEIMKRDTISAICLVCALNKKRRRSREVCGDSTESNDRDDC